MTINLILFLCVCWYLYWIFAPKKIKHFYKSKKTGVVYEVINFDVTNSTNEQNGQKMILYKQVSENYFIYARDTQEFLEKFEEQ